MEEYQGWAHSLYAMGCVDSRRRVQIPRIDDVLEVPRHSLGQPLFQMFRLRSVLSFVYDVG
jgi:hypothetical protein